MLPLSPSPTPSSPSWLWKFIWAWASELLSKSNGGKPEPGRAEVDGFVAPAGGNDEDNKVDGGILVETTVSGDGVVTVAGKVGVWRYACEDIGSVEDKDVAVLVVVAAAAPVVDPATITTEVESGRGSGCGTAAASVGICWGGLTLMAADDPTW